MQLELDPTDRRVIVVGSARSARRVVRRYGAAGARVRRISAGTDRPTLLRVVGSAWLVVMVGLGPAESDRIRALTERLGTLLTEEPAASESGQVTLVGGGPGSPGLLTLAAVAALREADVVFYDRLAPTDALTRLAPGAELIDVGKTPYHHKITQDRIEDALIDRARRGDAVVRLKGGDPFVFGRGSEELQACAAAGLVVHVVPGVSSAVAVPATAGIPLTHRGVSRTFTVISGHTPPGTEESAALARLGGTLVILMGVANLTAISAGLAAAGMPARTPAAIVERGYTDSQRTTRSDLGRLADDARRLGVTAPAVVVIGEVARFGHELGVEVPRSAADPVAC